MRAKKIFALLTALAVLMMSFAALAEGQTPPAMPPEMGQGGPGGNPPDGMPGNPPDGMPGGQGGPGGMPGGGSSQPESYDAVNTFAEDTDIADETIESTGTDENAVLVTDGSVTLENVTVKRISDDSTGGDSASFYGVGAALLATGGTLSVSDSVIETDAKGGAGVFAYGSGTAVVTDTTIATTQDTSGGIHVAGGGTLYARNLTVTTEGGSSAAIRSDRGSGTMVVDGGSYTSNGSGSPAVYVTADITIHGADLTATGSEALCLEGLNAVRLYDCNLTGDMPDQEQNDNTWTVILYQSMSGDAEVGKGSFEMVGGSLTSANGGLLYTTNTQSEFILSGVRIEAAEDSEYFLRCTGNSNKRGWGQTGANGADCTFTAITQEMAGDVIWDSISTLRLYVTEGSVLKGAVIDDESCAGTGGDGSCTLVIDADSTWVVTGDSTVTNLACEGTIADAAGNAVTIVKADGMVLSEGSSEYTVTVTDYSTSCDLSGAGSAAEWNADLFAAD
ncbi:MAG: hypothetical protein IJ573_05375 [Clostridia bacterium]|nr:hypothetical protein [Clostridia bacterium]